MKDFIFVSDFDGTLTKEDFYMILIEKYYKEDGKNRYSDWQNGKYKDVEFLDYIFSNVNKDEHEILDDIIDIYLDEHFEEFVQSIKNSGGDFLILSAGTSYYIEKLLEHKKIKNISIISNKGIYQDKGIHLVVDTASPFYSEIYGIDKGKVINSLKCEYKEVYFSGDSSPDIMPAKYADIAFATGKLKSLLDEINHPYIPFNNLIDIESYLKNIGVIKNA